MRHCHHIDGRSHPPAGDRWLDVVDPATGRAFAQVASGDAADVDAAISAARSAFPAWAALPNSERARWLEKLADALESRLSDFAHAESLDAGKPMRLA
ncbi:MAG TPA: aldehyde dehydrogenase family protein, partial [Lysobacter sp.]